MRSASAILLVLCFAAIGSGGVQRLHLLQHQAEDAAHGSDNAPAAPHGHNDATCTFHARLNTPITLTIAPAALLLLVLVAALAVSAAPAALPRGVRLTIDCRGPPAR